MRITHQQKIQCVADRIRYLNSKGILIRVYHGSTNSTRTLRFRQDEIVDISDLNCVLQIDTLNRTAVVEPNVPMDKLVAETMKYGLVPAVVPEFPGITIGGAIAGGSGESSSFRYGLVQNQALECELVLGSGEIVQSSPTKNPDLFVGLGATCGSIGILTAIELALVPATKFVRLKYIPVSSFDEAMECINKSAAEQVDFIDSIFFAKNRGVVMLGYRTDVKSKPVRRFSRAWDEWFYLHAQKMFYQGGGIETIPLVDYLFRYDRGAFWMGKHAFSRFRIPFNRLTRFILNPLLKTRIMYRGIQESNTRQEYFIQDASVPEERLLELLEYIDSKYKIYPLWLLPITPNIFSTTNIMTNISTKGSFIINVGVWSSLKLSYEDFASANIRFEEEVVQLGGCKAPYGHVYGEENLFWKNHNQELYEKVRKKYHAIDIFPSLYEKIRVRERYVPTVKKGFFRALRLRWRLPLS